MSEKADEASIEKGSEEREGTESCVYRARGFLVAVLYGVCSAGMAFVNKAVLNVHQYNYPAFLMCCQMVFTIIVFESLRLTKVVNIEAFTLTRGKTFFWASLMYALNALLALTALSGMNIPMYGAVKRCAPLAILLLGLVMLKTKIPSCKVVTAVLMITGGCILAGYGDLSLDPKAYVFGAASVFAQALYLILVQRSNLDNLSPLDTVHINSYNTLPFFLVMAAVLGDIPRAVYAFKPYDISFILMFLLLISMGSLLTFTLFLCTQWNSALTTSIVGSIKSIAQSAIGSVVFGGISINAFTVIGISVNLLGGIFYSYVKYSESKSSKK